MSTLNKKHKSMEMYKVEPYNIPIGDNISEMLTRALKEKNETYIRNLEKYLIGHTIDKFELIMKRALKMAKKGKNSIDLINDIPICAFEFNFFRKEHILWSYSFEDFNAQMDYLLEKINREWIKMLPGTQLFFTESKPIVNEFYTIPRLYLKIIN